LNDALGIWQAAVTNAVVEWVEFDDVDACNHRIEYIRALSDHRERFLHGRYIATVLEAVAVCGSYY
jgi:hypothetical protein